MVGAAVKTDVEKGTIEQQSDIVSDLLRKIKAFQACGCGAVLSRCSALSGAVSRSRACWRGVCRFSFLSVVSSILVCASGQHIRIATSDATCALAQGTQQGSKVILSFVS